MQQLPWQSNSWTATDLAFAVELDTQRLRWKVNGLAGRLHPKATEVACVCARRARGIPVGDSVSIRLRIEILSLASFGHRTGSPGSLQLSIRK